MKPSDEFNISQQHTELRLLSNDITKLNIDETKLGGDIHRTVEPPPSKMLEFDEDEDNPLGSEEMARGVEGTETVQDPNAGPLDISNEVSTLSTEDSVLTNDKHSPSSEKNIGEAKDKGNAEGPGDEEGELC